MYNSDNKMSSNINICLLTFLLMLFFIMVGCNSAFSRKSNIRFSGRHWGNIVYNEIEKLETYVIELENIKKSIGINNFEEMSETRNNEEFLSLLGDLDHEKVKLIFRYCEFLEKANKQIYKLWESTGNCLFIDIERRRLVSHTSEIIKRYLQFIETNKTESFEEIIRRSLPGNIDDINTDYGLSAVYVLQEYINYKNKVPCMHKNIQGNSLRAYRLKAKNSMETWFRRNNDMLRWNEILKKFSDENNLAYMLPKPVVEFVVISMNLPPKVYLEN